MRYTTLFGAVVAGCLLVPAAASGAVTIGSNLSGTPSENACGDGTACTFVQTAVAAPDRAGGGLVAPSDGVIVRWRLKSGSDGGTARLRVLRPAGGMFTGAGTSVAEPVAISVPNPNVYTTSLRIRAGDSIGLDNSTSGLYFGNVASATIGRFSPFLMDTQTLAPTGSETSRQLMIQADIEPDCDSDGLGDETQDSNLAACNSAPPAAPPSKPAKPVLRGTRVTGTAGADSIFCGPGNSVVKAGGGNDKIVCGPGNDDIDAGAGKDSVTSGGGKDDVAGGTGDDDLSGGTGNDRLAGGSGADDLNGGSGRDRLRGGSGNDRLRGGSGDDTLLGGSGRDRVTAGSGNDRISARDRRRELIDCGTGRRDRVTADRTDRVSRNCERVSRRG